MRLNGHRVLGAPNARIAIQSESFGFAAAPHLEIAKTQIRLLTAYRNPLVALVGGIFAPVGAVLLAVWLVLVKRPERIGTALATGFWWFGNGISLAARRPKLSAQQRAGIKSLRVLFATREDIQRSIRAKVEQPAAIAEANLEATDETPRFFVSGGLWWLIAIAAVSWQFWPKGIALSGGGVLPLGSSLADLFSRAGASWQHSGFGTPVPSDPFNWVLFALGAITFWAPTLSVTILVFLVKPLAFASAWLLLSLVTRRRSLLALGALIYAFWPALTTAQQEARLGTVIALILLPLFVFTLARILQFGASPRRSVQTWTWVGTSALLAAVISAGAPSLTPLLAAVILLLAIYRFKRIGYLIWLPVPLLVMWLPIGWNLVVGQLKPLALLTDPGVPVVTPHVSTWQLLLGTAPAGLFSQWVVLLGAVPLAIAALATVSRRSLNALLLWLALLAAVASAAVLNSVWFRQQLPVGSGTSSITNLGSPYALVGLAGLICAVLAVIALDSSPLPLRAVGAVLLTAVVLVQSAQFTLRSSNLSWNDGSTMPALVLAQAAVNPGTRVLELEPQPASDDRNLVTATLVSGSGIKLQDVSNAYNYSLPARQHSDSRYRQLAQVVANLVSGNGTDLSHYRGIDYVLISKSPDSAQLAASMDTVAELEPVGITDYGHLYRNKASQFVKREDTWDWSVTKQVQVAVLALFAMLAIPTRRRVGTGQARDEEELDAFDGGFEGEAF